MKQTLDNGDTGLEFRTKCNENFTELYDTPMVPTGTPVNATPAGFVATINSRPDDYVKNIQSGKTLTVATQPHINVQASGTITVTGTPVAEETFTVYDQTFTFKAARTGVGEVTIDANNNAQATNIAAAIAADVAEVTAVDSTNTVLVTAVEAAPFVGTGGNVIVFTESATGIAVTGAGTLTDGVDADTLEINGVTYTFIANGLTPEALEIPIGTNQTNTAIAIVNNIITGPAYTLSQLNATFTVTATALGTTGDGITTLSDKTRITGDCPTAGGQDEVISYITINDIDYIFAESTGDDPSVEYPNCTPVITAAAASMEDIAAEWVAALKTDGDVFSNTSVSNIGAVVTGTYKEGGVVGTEVTYVNNLLVAGDITVTGVVGGTFSGDINGTPGHLYQMFCDGTNLYISTEENYTTSNDSWKKLTLLSL